MFKKFLATQVFILFVSSATILAQSIQIEAIEFTFVGRTAENDFGEFDSFVSKVREPSLFQSKLVEQIDQNGIITTSGFAIDFVFSGMENPNNEFVFGIQTGSVESEIFQSLTVLRDTLTEISDISNSSQVFTLKAGYQRIFRDKKRLKLILGTSYQLGIPVSAKTTQTFDDEFFGEEYTFFAKQHASFGISAVYGIRFKLFRNVSASFLSRPGLYWQQVDGTPTANLLRGTNLSFRFKIKP